MHHISLRMLLITNYEMTLRFVNIHNSVPLEVSFLHLIANTETDIPKYLAPSLLGLLSRPQMLQTSWNNYINHNLCKSNLFSETNETNPCKNCLMHVSSKLFPIKA
ncbi:unnamed protein product [Trichobilharzia szidati]|nr:unnamed protein product [Trichobilharzia szidati]